MRQGPERWTISNDNLNIFSVTFDNRIVILIKREVFRVHGSLSKENGNQFRSDGQLTILVGFDRRERASFAVETVKSEYIASGMSRLNRFHWILVGLVGFGTVAVDLVMNSTRRC